MARDWYRHQADLRARHGDRSLDDVIDEAIAAREEGTGIREQILQALDAAKMAMGDDVDPLLHLESLWGSRSLDYIRIAYSVGHEHGLNAQLTDDAADHDLAGRLADWLSDQGLDDGEAVHALVAVLAARVRGS